MASASSVTFREEDPPSLDGQLDAVVLRHQQLTAFIGELTRWREADAKRRPEPDDLRSAVNELVDPAQAAMEAAGTSFVLHGWDLRPGAELADAVFYLRDRHVEFKARIDSTIDQLEKALGRLGMAGQRLQLQIAEEARAPRTRQARVRRDAHEHPFLVILGALASVAGIVGVVIQVGQMLD